MVNKVIGYGTWKGALLGAFGSDAVFCTEPGHSKADIEKIVAAAVTPSGNEEEDKKHAKALGGLWVMDLGHEAPVLARKHDYSFFAVIVDDVGYASPVLVEEPDPTDPRRNKAKTVGAIQALIAIDAKKRVFVKTVTPNRPVATGKGGPPLLELDRTSTSKGQKLVGQEVGNGYANSARIRGLIPDLCAMAAPDAITTEPGWMPVEEFFLNAPDKLGKSALITALVAKGLVTFG